MQRTARALFTLWLVVSGSAGSPTPCFAGETVTARQVVEISRNAVRLSDVFDGIPQSIDRDIAQAPAPCKSAIYDEAVLNRLSDMYRLEWTPQGTANNTVITAACTRITSDMVRDSVIARIKASMPNKRAVYEVLLDTRTLEIDLPANQKPEFKLENFNFDPSSKQFRTDLIATASRGPFVTPITGRIAVKRNVPILAHRVESGTTISSADLDWILVPEERVTNDVITEAEQLVGREIRHDTAEGELLRSRDVMAPRLVRRNTIVTLKIETPFLIVTAQGKAQQDGAAGETIRVINTQSNRMIEGVVTGSGVVEVRAARNKVALAQ